MKNKEVAMYTRVGSYDQLDRQTVLEVIKQKAKTNEITINEVTWLINEVEKLHDVITKS